MNIFNLRFILIFISVTIVVITLFVIVLMHLYQIKFNKEINSVIENLSNYGDVDELNEKLEEILFTNKLSTKKFAHDKRNDKEEISEDYRLNYILDDIDSIENGNSNLSDLSNLSDSQVDFKVKNINKRQPVK